MIQANDLLDSGKRLEGYLIRIKEQEINIRLGTDVVILKMFFFAK
jgi:hypothetical protein